MLYLSGHVGEKVRSIHSTGFMLTPAMGNRPDLSKTPWGADNGCFSQGSNFKVGRFITWLEETMDPYKATCLFAVAPDVVGDAKATWERSRPVLPLLRSLGYKAALVAQNGFEQSSVEWDAFDVLFIGGTTRWKLSQAAAWSIQQAKAHGKWVHCGRVNSLKRLQHMAQLGVDSADGTYLKYGPAVNLPKLEGWLNDVKRETSLWMAGQLAPKEAPALRLEDLLTEIAFTLEGVEEKFDTLMPKLPPRWQFDLNPLIADFREALGQVEGYAEMATNETEAA